MSGELIRVLCLAAVAVLVAAAVLLVKATQKGDTEVVEEPWK